MSKFQFKQNEVTCEKAKLTLPEDVQYLTQFQDGTDSYSEPATAIAITPKMIYCLRFDDDEIKVEKIQNRHPNTYPDQTVLRSFRALGLN